MSEKTWFTNIQTNWDLLKIGSVFNLRNQKVNDVDYAPLSVSKGGIVPQISTVAKSDAHDSRKLVLKGDFVINSRSDRKMSCGVSKFDGSVSLINLVLEPNKIHVDSNYVNYLLKNYGFAEEFYKWGHGIVADLWTTGWDEMKVIYIPVPPLPIQNRIVEILDDKISKIDALIQNENKQIVKLEEYKKAVITKAVTKGLNSNTKMKDSGIKWIGMIPDEWSLNRIKFISLCNPESLSNNENMQLSINYVDIGSVSLNNGIEKTEFFKFSNAPSRARRILKKDDVIISTVRTYLKAIAVVDRDGLIGSTGFCVLRPRIDFINPAFLGYYCKSNVFTNEVSKRSVGISYPAINSLELISLYITYPSMAKQKQIADYLDEKCEKIKRIIEIKKSIIEKLQAYKKSLIYEYVTGKKEVSNA